MGVGADEPAPAPGTITEPARRWLTGHGWQIEPELTCPAPHSCPVTEPRTSNAPDVRENRQRPHQRQRPTRDGEPRPPVRVLAVGSALGAACVDWRHRRQIRAIFRIEAAAELAFAVAALTARLDVH